MLTLARADRPFVAGTWFPWIFGPDRILGSVVTCPACQTAMSIGGGRQFGSCHQILGNGTVSPSVVCPTCGWHVMVQLAGWAS